MRHQALGTGSLVAIGAGGVIAALAAVLLLRRTPRRLVKKNLAGRPVPAVLGYALWLGVAGGALLLAAGQDPSSDRGLVVTTATVGIIGVLLLVGALDDLFGGVARGIGGHLRSLTRGRPTTGILKLVVGVAVAVILALHLADDAVRMVGIALLVATCTNLWNALDVVPGRALKWGAIGLIAVVAVGWSRPSAAVLAAALGSVLALLPFDLRERAMLGDAGSNPLGFLVGLGLAVVLPTPGLLVAAVLAVLLQAAAETVTLSRLIEALPPLRWFDGLGRRSVPAS